MSETLGQTMGRNLRPQNASTQGLRQNQVNQGGTKQVATNNVGSVGQDPIALLNNLIAQYTSGFNEQSQLGSNRLQDQLNAEMVKRGLFDSESAVDIMNRNQSDYQAQQNAALAQGLVPLYTGLSSLAQQAMEAERAREYNSQFAREQIENQLGYQRKMIPINVAAYRAAWMIENALNSNRGSGNPGMAAANAMAAGAALGKPLKINSLEDTPKKPWDPSQGPPSRGDNVSGYTYNPGEGTWTPAAATQQQWAEARNVGGNFDITNALP